MKLFTLIPILIVLLGIITSPFIESESNDFIYYTSNTNSNGRDIYRMDVDGQNKIKLTRKHGNGHYPHNNGPKISPDGSKIVYHSDADGHDRYTIWTMNVDGSDQKKITQNEGLYPTWSPDGKHVLFTGRRNGVWEILLAPIDGGREEFITNNKENGIRPGWGAASSFHPDGKSFVYSYVRETVMYSMNLETKKIERLSPIEERYMSPTFSKDGSRIAVNRKKDEGYDLVIVSAEGTEAHVIAKNIVSFSAPSWSDSGEELLFTGVVNGSREIFRINIETGQEYQLTSNDDFDAMPTWN